MCARACVYERERVSERERVLAREREREMRRRKIVGDRETDGAILSISWF